MGRTIRRFPLVLLLAVTPSFVARADEAGRYFPSPDSNGGWRIPRDSDHAREVASINLDQLDEALTIAAASTKNGGLLIARNGWLVYEKYFGKGQREATPNLASCGKSITSIAVGILISQRPDLFPEGLDQRIYSPTYLPPMAFPLSDPRKKEIKLGHLLSMSAGIRGNNPAYVKQQPTTIEPAGPDGWQGLVDEIVLSRRDGESRGAPVTTKTLWCSPGEGYSYATGSIHIASIVLRHVSGQELEDYVRKNLAQPLGWGRWGYGYKYAEDVTHTPGGGGIALRATDMLRFGYLLLNEGRWNDRQIVPAEYVQHCSSESRFNPHFPYSLQFKVNSTGLIADLPGDAYWKSGSGGHVLYVVPSLDLVVWKLGGRDGQYSTRDTGLPMPKPLEPTDDRSDWKATVDADTALADVLKKVIAAIE